MPLIYPSPENYSSVLQDEVQGYHWSKTQSTIHPWVAYYKQDGELKCLSTAIISNRLKHDTQSVHLFKKKMIEYLLDLGIVVNHIFYFSDGAASRGLYYFQKWGFFIKAHIRGLSFL